MKVYHGTTTKFLARIRREGLRKYSWVTDQKKAAEGFTTWAVERFGGEPVVIAFSGATPEEMERSAWSLGGNTEGANFWKFKLKPKLTLVSVERMGC